MLAAAATTLHNSVASHKVGLLPTHMKSIGKKIIDGLLIEAEARESPKGST